VFAVVPAETDVEQGPLERPEVLQLVRDRLADILEGDIDDLVDALAASERAEFVGAPS